MVQQRELELNQGTWGWDRTGRYWVPPQWAGEEVECHPLEKWRPNPVNLGPFKSAARWLLLVASRRGGKTHVAGRIFSKRIMQDFEKLMANRDTTWDRYRFAGWFEETVGDPDFSRPNELLSEPLKRHKAPLEYWAVAPDYELSNLQAAELSDIWDRKWVRDVFGVRWFGNILWILGLGIKISLKTAEHPEKLVGHGLNGVWAGEAARIKDEAWEHFFPAINDRNGFFLADTTPRSRNWIYNEIVAMCNKDVAEELGEPDKYQGFGTAEMFHWTVKDNLAVPHLAAMYDRALKVYGPHSRYFIENFAATFDQPYGMVWATLNKQVHYRRFRDDAFQRRWAGLDWGYGHPGCIGFLGYTKDHRLNMYGGFYGEGILDAPSELRGLDSAEVLSSNTWAGMILREYERTGERFTVFADPSRPDSIRRLRGLGIDCRPADASPGAINDSISAVDALLAYDPDSSDARSRQAMLTFDNVGLPPAALKDIWGYEWATDRQGNSMGIPSKKPDRHFADVVRYVCSAVISAIRLSRIAQFSIGR